MKTRNIGFIALAMMAQAVAAVETIDSLSLNEVVVTGTRGDADVRQLPMTVTVIDRQALTEQHQTNILPTVAQRVPGFFVTSRSMMGYGVSGGAAGGINLRGISGGTGQMLVLIDGHPQYNGVYGHPIADSYQTLLAERVEVVRGPASVLYGSNAMGGVVNIVTRAMPADGVATNIDLGVGSYGTIHGEVANRVRCGRFTSTVALQGGRTDNHRPRMGFQQYGGYAKVGYDLSDHWRATADVNVTHFDASHPGTTDSPLYDADQWITRGVTSLAVENSYGRTRGAVSLFYNFGRHKIDDGTADPAQPTQRYFRSKDALAGASWWQSAQLFRGNRVTLGLDYQHIYGHAYYTSKQTGDVLDTPNKQSGHSHRNEVAAYLDFRQDIARWLTIDAGVRLDHHSITGTEWVPQGGIVVRPISHGEIKAMASKGFRNPTMRELYLYPPSNEELLPERLWNYELSWRHRAGAVTYGANVFYIKGSNIIQTQPVDGRPRNVNTGSIENCGMEVEAAWRINDHWALSTNHSYLRMENPVLAAPTYKGVLAADFRHTKWTVNATLMYVGGLYTAVGADATKENFCLLNLAASFSVHEAVSIWLRGENLLAQRYETVKGYPMPKATVMGGVSIAF
ncbi:MAG: TonB-dependent receptor [Bacteroidaceae bacterium]|nr:TonB-dependent receptor [Bacteroidaceae bacterium]